MNDSGENHSTARGFFHTMVVMGGALALGCGGESRALQLAPEGVAGMNTDGAGGGAGSGGTASSAAGSGALGSVAGSGGSAISIGGTGGVISVGGNGGSSGMASLLNCPTTQWTCKYGGCDGYNLTGDYCTCDAARPKTVADCLPGDAMVCIDGVQYNASANATTEHVPYECQCIPRQPDCLTTCEVAAGGVNAARMVRCTGADPTAAPDPTEPVLCGCAPIVLK